MTQWHSESALLACSLEYAENPRRAPPTLAARIDAALHVSSTPPRAHLGPVQVTWRDANRLHSIELRTNPTEWQPASLPTPIESTPHSSMTLALDYDLDGMASVDLDVRILSDARRANIALRFRQVQSQSERWATLADGAFIRVDDQHTLTELRFTNVQMVLRDPSPSS